MISSDEITPPALLLADYHIAPGSHAINRVPALAWVVRDVDGEPRPFGALSDAGADEVQYEVVSLFLPLVLRNY